MLLFLLQASLPCSPRSLGHGRTCFSSTISCACHTSCDVTPGISLTCSNYGRPRRLRHAVKLWGWVSEDVGVGVCVHVFMSIYFSPSLLPPSLPLCVWGGVGELRGASRGQPDAWRHTICSICSMQRGTVTDQVVPCHVWSTLDDGSGCLMRHARQLLQLLFTATHDRGMIWRGEGSKLRRLVGDPLRWEKGVNMQRV